MDPKEAAALLPLIYDEVRRLAECKLAQEKPGQTLQPTALVHDAYVRLVGGSREQEWEGRSHLLGALAETMRRILIDNARRKQRVKHGGDRRRVELDEVAALDRESEEILAVDAALSKLAQEAPQQAELVKLRYFAGMTLEQAADAIGISRATAARYWSYAKAYLYCELRRAE